MILVKISVRLYFNEAGICIGGLALEAHSEKFNFNGDYYASEDAQIYPSQDVQGKTWATINKERVKIWYEAMNAKKSQTQVSFQSLIGVKNCIESQPNNGCQKIIF